MNENSPSLHWPLEVLARATAHPNATAAAAMIGLSQPQISRLVLLLERELGLELLDRRARRKAHWTQAAHDLSRKVREMNNELANEVRRLRGEAEPKVFKLGALEGLMDVALRLAEMVFQRTAVVRCELEIRDLIEIESLYLNRNLDVVLTSRSPARASKGLERRLGYQILEQILPSGARPGERQPAHSILALSPAEASRLAPAFEKALDPADRPEVDTGQGSRSLVTNSLEARVRWVESHGGIAWRPSSLVRKPEPDQRARKSGRVSEKLPVLLVWRDGLGPSLSELLRSGRFD